MRIPLFDAHCDTVWAMHLTKTDFEKNGLHIDLERASKYQPYAQFFALFGDVRTRPDETLDALYSIFFREIAGNGAVSLCRTAGEADNAAKQGKIAAFISVEGAEMLDCSPQRLTEAYDLGVRAVTLTWNYENDLSGSNAEGSSVGLKPRGVEFVKRCRELGVLVDVSHISEPGFWDVLELAEMPVIATHSNSRSICDHPRNLTDRQFAALAGAGGVAGINLYSEFLGDRPGIDTVRAHIERFLELGGEKSVAVGGDFDGCDTLPDGIGGIEDIEKIYNYLLRKNYTEDLVCDIFYNNLMRVVREVCDI